MRRFIDGTIKPVLIIGGLGTAMAGADAFFPQFTVENVHGLEWVQDYTIFVQHWGFAVGLAGVFMIAAAFIESWRVPILLYALLEKAFIVYLVASNARYPFSEGFYVAAIMDSLLVVYLALFFISRGSESSRRSFPWRIVNETGESSESVE